MTDPAFSDFDDLEAVARRHGTRIAFRRHADDRYAPVAFSLTDPIPDGHVTTVALLLGDETYIVRRQDLTELLERLLWQ